MTASLKALPDFAGWPVGLQSECSTALKRLACRSAFSFVVPLLLTPEGVLTL